MRAGFIVVQCGKQVYMFPCFLNECKRQYSTHGSIFEWLVRMVGGRIRANGLDNPMENTHSEVASTVFRRKLHVSCLFLKEAL
jgi:hypothetical protein